MFFSLLAGGSIFRGLNAYDEWDLERIKWGEHTTKLAAEDGEKRSAECDSACRDLPGGRWQH